LKSFSAQIQIQSLSSQGKGRGHFVSSQGEEKQAEIPFALPEETVEAVLGSKRSGHYQGILRQVITPSPLRILPRCMHFGDCGGCTFQHLIYEAESKWKEEKVKTLFAPLLDNETAFFPILAAAQLWEYRNKMEYTFTQDKGKNRFLGLIKGGSRGKVFNLKECFLTSPWFSKTVGEVRAFWETTDLAAYHPASNRGTLRTLILRESVTTKEQMAMLTVSGNPLDAIRKHDLQKFKEIFGPKVSLYLRIHQVLKGQPTQFFEMHLQGPECIEEVLSIDIPGKGSASLYFKISPSSFFQPNTRQAMHLYARALQLAEVDSEDLFFDLYCGTGTIGMLASRFVKKAIGIEISTEAALDGRENIKNNQIQNMEIYTGDVGDSLRKASFGSPSLVCVDPPRAGLGEKTVAQILELTTPRILYISCNPSTQVQDIKLLLKSGYRIKAVQPVDPFAHTPHIENIAVLDRRG
jgi:23S rRNA (uracil1939-C5)-methyltransferase